MLQLNIATQSMRLEYDMRNAQLNLQTTRPVVQMKTTPATVETHQPHGDLTMDMTPCRYSIGLKNNTDFARDNAEYAKQMFKNGITRTVQEGVRLSQIENKSNAIAEIAANETLSEVPEVTLAYIELPNIQYRANPVQFNPINGKVSYTVQQGAVQADYQPASFDIQVTQYPRIQFSTVDVEV